MLIAFEGVDGAGKTTQAHAVSKLLGGDNEVITTPEPTHGPIGTVLREILGGAGSFDPTTIQLLFTADRSHHVNTVINPSLKSGKVVITDRYILSTMAYGTASGLDADWLHTLNEKFPWPDINLIFDIDPKTAMDRLESRFVIQNKEGNADPQGSKPSIFEKLDFMTKVRELYGDFVNKYPNCFIIDARKPADEVTREIMRIIEQKRAVPKSGKSEDGHAYDTSGDTANEV